uniref:Uncharacterized protein n=1 Tax=Cacopsylla melanoneura TaxID=428564 RepID=A0A8D8RY05_9HEMI
MGRVRKKVLCGMGENRAKRVIEFMLTWMKIPVYKIEHNMNYVENGTKWEFSWKIKKMVENFNKKKEQINSKKLNKKNSDDNEIEYFEQKKMSQFQPLDISLARTKKMRRNIIRT